MIHDLKYNKFLLFGDSITEFAYDTQPGLNSSDPAQFSFGSAVTNAYARRLDVVQRGFAGYTTREAKVILPRIIANETSLNSKILISTVFFGTNDSYLGGPQAVPINDFILNFRDILDIYVKNNIKVIIIGPGKHDAKTWELLKNGQIQDGSTRTNENNLVYSNSLLKISEEYGFPFVNLYEIFSAVDKLETLYLADGIHFSGEGYKILFIEVMRLISERYPGLSPKNLEYILPSWQDVKASEL